MLLRNPFKASVAAALYLSGLLRIIRFLGRKYPKILVYHSINHTESAFIRGSGICVSPSTFERHLRFLTRNYRIVPLRRLVHSFASANVEPRSLALTFDDGFADFFDYAYPLLKRYNAPATMFLIPDCIDNAAPNWLQEFYYLVNTFGIEQVTQEASILAQSRKMQPFRHADHDIKGLENYLAFVIGRADRLQFLNALYVKFNLSKTAIFAKNKIYLTLSQIKQMSQNGISFGNHGKTHTPFSAMTLQEQEKEIFESGRVLHRYFDGDFSPFAFPFGRERDFTSASTNLLRKYDYHCALTTSGKTNRFRTSPYELARIPIHDLPLYKFAVVVESWCLESLRTVTGGRSETSGRIS